MFITVHSREKKIRALCRDDTAPGLWNGSDNYFTRNFRVALLATAT